MPRGGWCRPWGTRARRVRQEGWSVPSYTFAELAAFCRPRHRGLGARLCARVVRVVFPFCFPFVVVCCKHFFGVFFIIRSASSVLCHAYGIREEPAGSALSSQTHRSATSTTRSVFCNALPCVSGLMLPARDACCFEAMNKINIYTTAAVLYSYEYYPVKSADQNAARLFSAGLRSLVFHFFRHMILLYAYTLVEPMYNPPQAFVFHHDHLAHLGITQTIHCCCCRTRDLARRLRVALPSAAHHHCCCYPDQPIADTLGVKMPKL